VISLAITYFYQK